jgi:hypothetical protein
MSNLYDTSRWKTPIDCRLLAFAMLPVASDLKQPHSTSDAPLYMSVKLGLISTPRRARTGSGAQDMMCEAFRSHQACGEATSNSTNSLK